MHESLSVSGYAAELRNGIASRVPEDAGGFTAVVLLYLRPCCLRFVPSLLISRAIAGGKREFGLAWIMQDEQRP
jgi:hypothetical protein